ncbi:Hsp20/alpha crystallin family protein [Desulfospira joergensenii]|uniref:Hsp20/alpha crystallin family protein n=1 Tax=Desulfospira joergensenii TaxID=53329 RepID=UPI0003B79B26|nr:Hsp20/alpha crystallin family protein [Desulfospira joergensenii]
MRLVRYNPLSELSLFRNSFNGFFNDPQLFPRETRVWNPLVDILDQEDAVVLNVELPGLSKEDISIDIKEKVLTIKGERKLEQEEKKENYYKRERSFGCFQRSFSLSDDILTDEVSADFKDGILKITLKKNPAKEEVKQITIH